MPLAQCKNKFLETTYFSPKPTMQIEYVLQNMFDTKVKIEFSGLSKRWGPLAFT
jgi:hypothetical protein